LGSTVGVHIDLVNSVVIGWIVSEFEVSATVWRSHHVVFSESITFFVQPPAFEWSEITVHVNVFPHHSELISGWDDEWIVLGTAAFGWDKIGFVNRTFEWIAKWTLWVIQVIALNFGDVDRLDILGWEWFFPTTEEGSFDNLSGSHF
jgi:hypothetical protein